MSLSYVAAGTATGNSTDSVALDWPAGLSAGDHCLAVIVQKADDRTMSTPSGWTLYGSATGGLGTNGTSDQGTVKLWLYGYDADGSESGTTNFSSTGGTKYTQWGRTFAFRSGTGAFTISSAVTGADGTADTSFSVTFGSDPGLDTGDWAITAWAHNTDAYSPSSHALSATGTTSTTTSRGNSTTTAGTQLRAGLVSSDITAGPSSAAATYSHTASGSSTYAPTGPAVMIRLREASTGPSGTATVALVLDADATGTVAVAGTATVALALDVAATGTSGGSPVTGTATVALALSVSATGTVPRTGTATAALVLDVAATGTVPRTGVASVALALDVTATGTVPRTGTAAAPLVLDVAATGAVGTVPITGSAAVSLVLDLTATGTVPRTGTATVALTLDVGATGTVPRTGTGAVALVLDLSSTGTVTTGSPYAGQVRVAAARGPAYTFYAGAGPALVFTAQEPET